jgi:arabinofuranosyltransferase
MENQDDAISNNELKIRGGLVLSVVVIVFFVVVLLRNAWVTEDAFITFRVVDNFINGFGLRWNVAERVQAYTHPLWMLLMIPAQFLGGEAYFSSIFLSIVLSVIIAALILFVVARSMAVGMAVVMLLASSKAFVDYSVAGLENPLTHLLLVIFFLVYLKCRMSVKVLFYLSLIASLVSLSRMDAVLFLLPVLLVGVWKFPKKEGLLAVVLGFAPFFAWSLFSLIYYGSVFPNTAYAKLGHGIPQVELMRQSFYYFIDSLSLDPLTLFVVGIGIATPFVAKDRRLYPVVAGVLFYLWYIVRIGGDFMSGRFFTAPLLVSVVIVSAMNIKLKRGLWGGLVILVVLFSMQWERSPLWSGRDYATIPGVKEVRRSIADERGYYYDTSGFLNAHVGAPMPHHPWAHDGQRRRLEGPGVYSMVNMGYFGYYAGPESHIIDVHALTDPLMARLPSSKIYRDPFSGTNWRVGHFARDIPVGYIKTLETGENVIKDQNIAEYWEHLKVVTRGRVWNVERLIEVWKINTGSYDYLLDAYVESLGPA